MQYLEGGRTVFLVFNNTEAQGKGVEMGFVVTQIEGQVLNSARSLLLS